MRIKKRNIFRIIWFSIVTVFFVVQCSSYQSRDLPENTFTDNSEVTIKISDDKITFVSLNSLNSINKNEIIFFQGGLTDPKAYAPLCRQIAENGFTCHLIKMDWRMPQWDYTKINKMFDLQNGNFIIGGHSQGAKIASQFIFENSYLMNGLFLLGTSHPRDFDLSERTLPTIKLYAQFDGLASVSEVMENKLKLPKNTDLIEVLGGNHSQFGYLGKLLTDENPLISLTEQQSFTLNALIGFFKNIE